MLELKLARGQCNWAQQPAEEHRPKRSLKITITITDQWRNRFYHILLILFILYCKISFLLENEPQRILPTLTLNDRCLSPEFS